MFAVTNYWDPDIRANPDLEEAQGAAISDAAAQANVKHLVFRYIAMYNSVLVLVSLCSCS